MDRMESVESVEHLGRLFEIEYYSMLARSGRKRYFAKISFEERQSVIIDEESMIDLKALIDILFPLLLQARSI